jgi:hypothetical protein
MFRVLVKLRHEHGMKEGIQQHQHNHQGRININLFARLNLALKKNYINGL